MLSLGVRYEYQTTPPTPRELNGLSLLPVGGSAELYGVSGKGNLLQQHTSTQRQFYLPASIRQGGRRLMQFALRLNF